jgi:hypothetical protein
MALTPAVEFRSPKPPAQRWEGQVDWNEVVATLKEAKNEWGYVGNYSSGIASHIRSGRYKQFHPHADDQEAGKAYVARHWEVTVRKADDDSGLYELYIRWLG